LKVIFLAATSVIAAVMPLRKTCDADMTKFPPTEIADMPVLRFAHLDGNITPTGNTVHTINGHPVGPICQLAICDGGGHPNSFYLFSCDADWNVITDTHHLSIDEALGQAGFEYENIRSAWRHPTDD